MVVSGAIVHEAHSAEELMELFEKGSSSRHVASTKMNAESSRSHLILSVVIESTNLTSGAVLKGTECYTTINLGAINFGCTFSPKLFHTEIYRK